MIRVGEQREVHVVLFVERLDRFDRVGRDAEDDRVVGGVGVGMVADRAGLGRAARRVRLGIKMEDDGLPLSEESVMSSPSWFGRAKSGVLVPVSGITASSRPRWSADGEDRVLSEDGPELWVFHRPTDRSTDRVHQRDESPAERPHLGGDERFEMTRERAGGHNES
jgi:hypothetical protein